MAQNQSKYHFDNIPMFVQVPQVPKPTFIKTVKKQTKKRENGSSKRK
jgi:hypothetical protein